MEQFKKEMRDLIGLMNQKYYELDGHFLKMIDVYCRSGFHIKEDNSKDFASYSMTISRIYNHLNSRGNEIINKLDSNINRKKMNEIKQDVKKLLQSVDDDLYVIFTFIGKYIYKFDNDYEYYKKKCEEMKVN